IQWYEAALGICPTYAPALAALGRLYTAAESGDALIRMHLAVAEHSSDNARRADAHGAVAEILETRQGKPDVAAEQHARALGLDPGREGSFKALCRLYARARRYPELVELYSRAADRASDEDVAIAYLFKMGALHEDALQDPASAVPGYRRILKRQPNNLGAIHALQRAADAGCRYGELCEALELEAKLAQDQTRVVALLQRAAEVLEHKLRDPEAALDRLRRVVELVPSYAPALSSLARLYQALGRHEDLLGVYERELGLCVSSAAEVELLYQMGELCERALGDEDRAALRYRQAIAKSPRHLPSLRALGQLLRRRGDFQGLVEVLEAELGGESEPGARARTLYRIGEVFEVHLGRPERALAAYRKALEQAGDYRPAADGAARMSTELCAWSALAADLTIEASKARDGRLAIDALLRAGDVHGELLGEPGRAVAAYEAVRVREPGSLAALLALGPLYRQAGAWEKLGECYRALSAVVGDVRARAAALEELARLGETREVGGEAELREIYQRILALDPASPVALAGLEKLALASGDRKLLADVDARIAQSGLDATMVAVHQTRLGESLELVGAPAALGAYRAALAGEPASLAAIRGLARVAERMGDAAGMVEAASREASFVRDGKRAAELLLRAALLRLEHMGDQPGAMADAEHALERWPDGARVAELLGELLGAAGQTRRLVKCLSQAAAAAAEPARQAALWREVARLYADLEGDLPAAIAALVRVLGTQPDEIATLRYLAALYARDAQWENAVVQHERIAKVAPVKEDKIEALLGLGRIFATRLGDTKRAQASLNALLRLEGGHREALGLLADVHEREGNSREAAKTARLLLEATAGPTSRAAVLLRIGRLELQNADLRKAADALREAVAIQGPLGEAAEPYRDLLGKEESFERYVEALCAHRQLVGRGEVSDEDLPATFLELARVQHEVLGRGERAVAALREGFEQCRQGSLQLDLALRLSALGRSEEALGEFQRLVAFDPAEPEAWRGMGRTLEEQGRASEAAVALAPLLVLGTATEAERALAQKRRLKPGWAHPRSFSAKSLHAVSAGKPWDEDSIAALLVALAEPLGKLNPSDLERHVVSRNRLAERAEHPVRELGERLAHALGLGASDFDLYVYERAGSEPLRLGDVQVELRLPPALLVPSDIVATSEAQQVFALGRVLCAVARGVYPAVRLPPREVVKALRAAAALAAQALGQETRDEEIAELQRRLLKAASRRSRKAMEEAAARYALIAGSIDLDRWIQTVEPTLVRAAAVLAGDLPAAVELVRRDGFSLLEGPQLVRGSATVADLLRFWASAPAMELRRQAGLVG
ncbi:MAG: tetratricopeptide repeat protein, partial [Deltaproteobacteria bacterium]|nr:tetratricopeptide repeat protein [Deltaproteobacteria bacterium]